MSETDRGFAEYFAARSDAMRRTAYLLCGDWHRAEDLVQTAFTRLYLAWGRVSRHDALDGYLRRTLLHAFLDERRLAWWRRVRPTGDEIPQVSPDVPVEDRLDLMRALAEVPARQRAVLVLRYWEDLSVDDTAAVLGVSAGTVKSQAARGLDTLRKQIAPLVPTCEES
ncbi:SigE family RNA polymerase sigma factor [Dactylosporangium roseum]|uniref:SigE family RNA polymerase sigma factor n=1 Tax=Dactylosporangium roseum TaxID=47989 RepID=A0ABY5YVT5_9ACTN|nr:SigE family RNA polymerase sigma factor [Dactylosporangium roseum]UWZ33860.1 SigE family RNA polymerase sigma factor [Dactylosporangium roseum]